MILKVVWRVVSGGGAEDTRSDDEGYFLFQSHWLNNLLMAEFWAHCSDDSEEEAEYTKQKAIPQQSDLKKRE